MALHRITTTEVLFLRAPLAISPRVRKWRRSHYCRSISDSNLRLHWNISVSTLVIMASHLTGWLHSISRYFDCFGYYAHGLSFRFVGPLASLMLLWFLFLLFDARLANIAIWLSLFPMSFTLISLPSFDLSFLLSPWIPSESRSKGFVVGRLATFGRIIRWSLCTWFCTIGILGPLEWFKTSLCTRDVSNVSLKASNISSSKRRRTLNTIRPSSVIIINKFITGDCYFLITTFMRISFHCGISALPRSDHHVIFSQRDIQHFLWVLLLRGGQYERFRGRSRRCDTMTTERRRLCWLTMFSSIVTSLVDVTKGSVTLESLRDCSFPVTRDELLTATGSPWPLSSVMSRKLLVVVMVGVLPVNE